MMRRTDGEPAKTRAELYAEEVALADMLHRAGLGLSATKPLRVRAQKKQAPHHRSDEGPQPN